MKPVRVAFATLALAVLAACAPARVRTVADYAGPTLPRPDRVIVYDFAIAPDQVRLDQGVGARIRRVVGDQPVSAQEWQAATAAQSALADALTAELASYGLPAMRAPGGAIPTEGTSLLVRGQIVGINEGNRTRRVLIGLGAGKSSVSADAQLYYAAASAPPRLISAFQGSSNSGRMPGLAGTMGVGAAAGRLATSAALGGAMHAGSEARRTGDSANAARLADDLGKQIGLFAVAQDWIAPSAVK
ncbi:MAG TPA: DUF4410 domain-containing protein [Acetobacteraceae bacterium]|nr:DUF4410 domain-containing protein [Acetobacteraceae bacterium]